MITIQTIAAILLALTMPADGMQDKELPEKYEKWIEEEVVYIISDREREVFYELEDNAQRDRFIEEFWKQRDPTPGSKKNEFKEEHYRRIEYANKWLGRESPAPGWKTDRGKIYIQLGEPKQKMNYYSHQKLMPMEIWFYQADPKLGVPPFFYTIFFKKYSVGDYILYDPTLHGPEALIYLNAGQSPEQAPMLIQEFDPELAQASISLVPTEPADVENYRGRPALSSVQLMSQLENIPNYRRDPTWAERILHGASNIETNYTFESEGLYTDFHLMKMPNGVPVLNFAFYYPTEELELGQYEDTVYAAIEAVFSVVTPDGKQVLTETMTLDQELDETQKNLLQAGGFLYEDNQVLLPGTYTVTLTVRNMVSRIFYSKSETINVPFRTVDNLEIIDPVLYVESETGQAMDPSAVQPYHFDRMKFHPLLRDQIRRGQMLGLFYQVGVPQPAEGGEMEPIKVDYVLRDQEDAAVQQKTIWLTQNQLDPNGFASVVWQFPTEELTAADTYHLEITAQLGKDKSIAKTRTFKVSELAGLQPGLLKTGYPINFLGSDVFIKQARLLMGLDRHDTAAALLARVVKSFKITEDLHGTYAEALEESGQIKEAAEVMNDMVLRFPEKAEFRRKLAMLYLRTGQHDKAIGHFERVRLMEGDSPEVLNALGEAYLRSGKEEKAREIWNRSLEINEDQPKIKQRLEQ